MAEESNQENKNNSSNALLELFQKIEVGNSKVLEKFQEFSENQSNLTNQIATMKKLGEAINIDISQTYQTNRSSFIKEIETSLDKTKNISLSLSEKDERRINKVENIFTRFWKIPIWIGFLSALVAGITTFLAVKFYSESVKGKEQFVEDLNKQGYIIAEKKEFEELKYNDGLVKNWAQKNPKDSESLEVFKGKQQKINSK